MAEDYKDVFITETIKYTARELAKKYQPECIICFGAIHTTVLTFGCFMEEFDKVTSQYHLLMVTRTATRIEHGVQDWVNFSLNSEVNVNCSNIFSFIWNIIIPKLSTYTCMRPCVGFGQACGE
jgi:hypothetical protein